MSDMNTDISAAAALMNDALMVAGSVAGDFSGIVMTNISGFEDDIRGAPLEEIVETLDNMEKQEIERQIERAIGDGYMYRDDADEFVLTFTGRAMRQVMLDMDFMGMGGEVKGVMLGAQIITEGGDDRDINRKTKESYIWGMMHRRATLKHICRVGMVADDCEHVPLTNIVAEVGDFLSKSQCRSILKRLTREGELLYQKGNDGTKCYGVAPHIVAAIQQWRKERGVSEDESDDIIAINL